MDVKRIYISIVCVIAFLVTYTLLLWSAYTAFIPNEIEMMDYIRHITAYKDLTFTCYTCMLTIMAFNYRTEVEKEILLTGLFSLIFITVLNTMHKLSIYIMSTQLMLILFNGITIALLIAVLIEGRRNELFKDNG